MPTFRAASSAVSSAAETSRACNVPAGLQDDDWLVAVVGIDDNIDIIGPAGWRRVAHNLSDVSSDRSISIWLRHVEDAAGEPSSHSWSAATSRAWAIAMAGYSGVDPTVPVDALVLPPDVQTNTATPTAPSITTWHNDATLLFASIGVFNPPGTLTAPGGMNSRVSVQSTTGGALDTYVCLADEARATAGATGTRAGSGVNAGTDSLTVLIALRDLDVVDYQAANDFSTEVSTDTPNRLYTFNDISGTTAPDTGSDAQNGTLTGGPTEGQGPFAPAIDDQAIICNDATEYMTATAITQVTKFSIEAIAKADARGGDTDQWILLTQTTTDGGDSNDGWGFRSTGDGTFPGFSATVEGLANIFPHWFDEHYAGKWFHVVANYDQPNSLIDVWLNGWHYQVRNAAWTFRVTPSEPFKVGGQSSTVQQSGRYWRGAISHVAFYGTPLTDARARAHFEAFEKNRLNANTAPSGGFLLRGIGS